MSDKIEAGVVVPVLASQSADSVVEHAAPPPLTLRQAREKAGLHVVALAVMLKVPVKKLEALEAGRFDELPDATFVRALALSVCRQLKIDPAPILANLPQLTEVRLDSPVGGLNARFPGGAAASSAGMNGATGGRMSAPVWLALVLLLAAGAVWLWMPQSLNLFSGSGKEGQAVTAVKEVVLADAAPAQAEVPPVPPVVNQPTATEQTPGVATNATEPVVAPAPAQAPAGRQETPPVGAEVTKPASATPVADEWLRLSARERSWIEVVSSPSGRLVMQRNLEAGETVAMTSGGPFAVVIGRVDATEVWVRGKRLDMEPLARSNVARFEVK